VLARAPRRLRAVRPSHALELWLRRRLTDEVEAMHRSVTHWLTAEYRRALPRIVQDESPASSLTRALRQLASRWRARWDELAARLAEHFAQSVEQRSSTALARMLREGGMTVKFQMTRAMQDVVDATVQQSVALIRSIPAQYLDQVEGIVMRGVQTGRDLHVVARELEQRLGVTRRRAALIARDQNSKATAALNRARQLEVGIEEAIWVHSGAGREPRPSHVRAGRLQTRFKIAEGWYDPDEKRHIQPGELINCRCVSRPIVPGFS